MRIFCRDGLTSQGLGQKPQLVGPAALAEASHIPSQLAREEANQLFGGFHSVCVCVKFFPQNLVKSQTETKQ